MWAPADLFTPTVNALALALKRTTTLLWDNQLYVVIAVAVVIALIVALKQLRRQPRA